MGEWGQQGPQVHDSCLLVLPPAAPPVAWAPRRATLRCLTRRDVLRALKRSEVLVRTWPSKSIPAQYFRVMDDDTPLCVGPCGHFFERDECELRALETGTLPFSKVRGS